MRADKQISKEVEFAQLAKSGYWKGPVFVVSHFGFQWNDRLTFEVCPKPYTKSNTVVAHGRSTGWL
jgi:hypothetical protein